MNSSSKIFITSISLWVIFYFGNVYGLDSVDRFKRLAAGKSRNDGKKSRQTKPSSAQINEPELYVPSSETLDAIRNTVLSLNFPNCEKSQTETSLPGFICKGQLLFEDEFNSDLTEDNIWTPEVRMPVPPDHSFNLYENRAEVRDGELHITPTTVAAQYGNDFLRRSLSLRESCTGTTHEECFVEAFGPQIVPPTITAKITTKRSFSFKYGKIEVRAKMPFGDWLVPLIQLEPRDNMYGSMNYASGLMRVACVRGNLEYSKNLYGGAILSEVNPLRTTFVRDVHGIQPWNKDYHIYTLIWQPDGLSMYVDEDFYGTIDPPNGFTEEMVKYNNMAPAAWLKGGLLAPLDEMFYVSLGLDVGGVYEFPDTQFPPKPWNNTSHKPMLEFWNAHDSWYPTWINSDFIVDYIRIYAV